jgi:2-amino-4-hydroxy-6-hydroxymethyldihydropteridine diphosphokinase
MIIVAIGANVPGPWGTPAETVARVRLELDRGPVRVVRWATPIVTAPFGVTDQPDFVNGAAVVATVLPPRALLDHLHAIERRAGRFREVRWGPRTLDLDLVDYNGLKRAGPEGPVLPHPGIAERDFVLKPIAEIASGWRHPETGLTAAEMLARLSA